MNIHQEELSSSSAELNNNISAGTCNTEKGLPGCAQCHESAVVNHSSRPMCSRQDCKDMGDCQVELRTKNPADLAVHNGSVQCDQAIDHVECAAIDPCMADVSSEVTGKGHQPLESHLADGSGSQQTAGGCYERDNNRPRDLPLSGKEQTEVCMCEDGSPCFCSSPLSVSDQVLRWQRLMEEHCGTRGMDAMTDGENQSGDLLDANTDDMEDSEEIRQCKKYMEDLVDRIFNKSTSISQEDNAKFGKYCQLAVGRQWFARLVDSQRVNSKKVTEQTFYRLVQFFAVCLFECNEADDFTPVKSLMNMCFTFYHEHEGYPRCDAMMRKSFLYSNLTDQPIWKSLRFWNAAFFDAVHHERKQRSPDNQVNWRHLSSEEREDTETLNENITFGQLATFLHNMMELGLPLDICQAFFDKMATIGNLSSDQKELIQINIQQHFHIDCEEENTKNRRHLKKQIKIHFMKRKGHRQETF
ncbi:uncharacterized protein [Asterias amurensis]|uniref:uncharacterized protein n=1 Tax=Asterias amurensis TaxID=7602 RepID=UPI003AB26D0A